MSQPTLGHRSKRGLSARGGLAAGVLLASALLPVAAIGAPVAERAAAPRVLAEGDAPTAPAPSAPVEVIFTGVARRADKGASIFVRMTGEVPVAFEQMGRRLVYRLSGAKLGVKNNANPLPTASFGPPVSNVALVAGDGVVDLVIDLTDDPGDKAPPHRVVFQSGIATLVVELPPSAR